MKFLVAAGFVSRHFLSTGLWHESLDYQIEVLVGWARLQLSAFNAVGKPSGGAVKRIVLIQGQRHRLALLG